MARTWNIHQGYELDCNCGCFCKSQTSLDMSGATISIDLSSIESRLDTLIADGVVRNDILDDMLSELVDMNAPLTQTITTTTSAGSIPAGVQSYAIFNLGIDPTDPLTTFNPMIVAGVTLSTRVISFSNSSDSTKTISNSISYDPNGNTLMIVYNA